MHVRVHLVTHVPLDNDYRSSDDTGKSDRNIKKRLLRTLASWRELENSRSHPGSKAWRTSAQQWPRATLLVTRLTYLVACQESGRSGVRGQMHALNAQSYWVQTVMLAPRAHEHGHVATCGKRGDDCSQYLWHAGAMLAFQLSRAQRSSKPGIAKLLKATAWETMLATENTARHSQCNQATPLRAVDYAQLFHTLQAGQPCAHQHRL